MNSYRKKVRKRWQWLAVDASLALLMSDLSHSALRTEIKTWERNFKARNAREPTVQDIRDNPAIAEKYKLYKKLSKAAAATAVFSNLTQSRAAPSTPRSNPLDTRPSLILSKKRTVEPAGPLSSFNPFSPQKNKGKQKDSIRSPVAKEGTRSSPFVTPTKTNLKRVEKPESSPDPFSAIQPFQDQATSSGFPLHPPAPTSALSRARKRLRGEPVSPSPTKEKRRRITSQTSLPFSKLNVQSPSSDESDHHDDSGAANSSFVDDSPVKRPVGGKYFQPLFDETVPQATMSTRVLSRSKTASRSGDLFGEPSHKMRSSNSLPQDEVAQHIGESRKDRAKSIGGLLSRGKADQFSEFLSVPKGELSHNVERRESAKRSLSDSETVSRGIPHGTIIVDQLPLLPPSPPPADSSRQSQTKYKAKDMGKGKSRKKAKVLRDVDPDEDDEESEDDNVKLIERSQRKAPQSTPDVDLDTLLLVPQCVGSPLSNGDAGNDAAEFHVDLPERLLHVLAISPSKVQDSKGERIVRGLLYGERATNYDPLKGGEIWDVGEGEDVRADTDAEDDWEPEPVPWEVGEL